MGSWIATRSLLNERLTLKQVSFPLTQTLTYSINQYAVVNSYNTQYPCHNAGHTL